MVLWFLVQWQDILNLEFKAFTPYYYSTFENEIETNDGVKYSENESVVSRIIITPQHAKKLSKALNDNIKRFEDNFGSIKDYDNPKFQMNFGPTGKA